MNQPTPAWLQGRWRPAWAPPAAAAAARLRRAYATAADAAGSIEGSELQQHKQLTILHFNDVRRGAGRAGGMLGGGVCARFWPLPMCSRSLLAPPPPKVYNIDSRPADPVGGVARFMAAARRYAGEQPLVLFSGDCLNPSLMSAFTRGEQMVQVLNCIGVHAACAGNHDCERCQPLRAGHAAAAGTRGPARAGRLRRLSSPPSRPPSPSAAVDFGIPTLQQHMQSFRFPWLLSNVLDARTGEPLGGCERSRIITWQGVRVGLMGLVEREVGGGWCAG